MKKIKNIRINKVIIITAVLGLLSGILLFYLSDADYSYYIKDFLVKSKTTGQNIIIYNAVLVTLIYILSLSIIGIILVYLIYYIEFLAVGFTTAMFFNYFKLKGIIFYILFFIESKLVTFLLLFYFINKSTIFVLRFIKSIASKNERGLFRTFSNHFFRFIIVLVLILLNSLIIKYLLGDITLYLISIL